MTRLPRRFGWVYILAAMYLGCSVDSARNHYLLAEKLWTDRKYAAAVSEFEKVVTKDPSGKLGLQAVYRAAMTQSLFLSQYSDAIRKFKEFIQASPDSQAVWEAQQQIGEILFSKMEHYDQAILHYRSMLKQNPAAAEAPEFQFRMAKSHFFLFQFDDAVKVYKELVKTYPTSPWAEKASFEIGATYFTRGEHGSQSEESREVAYEKAIAAYESFVKHYPKSRWVPEARFGIASCLEELDQPENAYRAFSELQSTYPSPNAIEIKLTRIRARIAQRAQRSR